MLEQISSTEFQRVYSRLSEPRVVTALGRPIGTWYPVGTEPQTVTSDALTLSDPLGRPMSSIGHSAPAPKPQPRK